MMSSNEVGMRGKNGGGGRGCSNSYSQFSLALFLFFTCTLRTVVFMFRPVHSLCEMCADKPHYYVIAALMSCLVTILAAEFGQSLVWLVAGAHLAHLCQIVLCTFDRSIGVVEAPLDYLSAAGIGALYVALQLWMFTLSGLLRNALGSRYTSGQRRGLALILVVLIVVLSYFKRLTASLARFVFQHCWIAGGLAGTWFVLAVVVLVSLAKTRGYLPSMVNRSGKKTSVAYRKDK